MDIFSLASIAIRFAGFEHQAYVKKVPGKGYCVKSKSNPDWSGGCYPTKGEAQKRLQQVEMFKSLKGKKKKKSSKIAIDVTKHTLEELDEMFGEHGYDVTKLSLDEAQEIADKIFPEYEEVQIQISFGPETDPNHAIKKAKEFIEQEGFKTREFFIAQQIGDLILVGNMEISPGFIEKFPDGWEGGWSEEDEGVIVTMEVP